jgi:molybdenum cofactor guanylyltransferase
MEFKDFSGVILAGGQNKRFNGRNKALTSFGGKRIFDYIYATFKSLFDHIIIVTNDPESYLEWDATIVTDLFPISCSLTGLHAGLYYTRTPFAFFSACDTPFLKADLVKLLLASVSDHNDIVLPETAVGLEPLCAVYSKRCLQPIETHLKQQKLAIRGIYNKLKVKTVTEKRLRVVDPELNSFFNVNTPQDLKRAREIIGREQN